MTPLKLFGSIGYDEDNDPNDIVQTGTALATLGRLEALDAAQSGEFGDDLDTAIRAYQSDNDLERDGILYPDGPTQKSINEALKVYRPGPSLLPAASDEMPEDPVSEEDASSPSTEMRPRGDLSKRAPAGEPFDCARSERRPRGAGNFGSRGAESRCGSTTRRKPARRPDERHRRFPRRCRRRHDGTNHEITRLSVCPRPDGADRRG